MSNDTPSYDELAQALALILPSATFKTAKAVVWTLPPDSNAPCVIDKAWWNANKDTLFGMPIVVDPLMPPNTIDIVTGAQRLRIENIKPD